jgi:hypothetical protein
MATVAHSAAKTASAPASNGALRRAVGAPAAAPRFVKTMSAPLLSHNFFPQVIIFHSAPVINRKNARRPRKRHASRSARESALRRRAAAARPGEVKNAQGVRSFRQKMSVSAQQAGFPDFSL